MAVHRLVQGARLRLLTPQPRQGTEPPRTLRQPPASSGCGEGSMSPLHGCACTARSPRQVCVRCSTPAALLLRPRRRGEWHRTLGHQGASPRGTALRLRKGHVLGTQGRHARGPSFAKAQPWVHQEPLGSHGASSKLWTSPRNRGLQTTATPTWASGGGPSRSRMNSRMCPVCPGGLSTEWNRGHCRRWAREAQDEPRP